MASYGHQTDCSEFARIPHAAIRESGVLVNDWECVKNCILKYFLFKNIYNFFNVLKFIIDISTINNIKTYKKVYLKKNN